MEVIMHNLISFNQLSGWCKNVKDINLSLDKVNEKCDIVNDYYNCLIEYQDDTQTCKRICRKILST
jgi:hypothetical protein